MVRVIITALADADTANILADLYSEAGQAIAAKYNNRFETLYDRLADYPHSGSVRPNLGPNIRVGVVYPYIVIYRHRRGDDCVSILRIVDGRRRITRKLLQGAP